MAVEQAQQKKVSYSRASTAMLIIAFILIVIVFAVFSILAFFVYHQIGRVHQPSAREESLVMHQVPCMQSAIAQQSDQIRNLAGRLDTLSQQVAHTDSRLVLLEEIKYLVRLADYKLRLEAEVGSALAILQTANDRVKSLPQQDRWVGIGKALEGAIHLLKRVPKRDKTELIQTIDQMDAWVKKISATPISSHIEDRKTEGALKDEQLVESNKLWQKWAGEIWHRLKQAVVIRRQNAGRISYVSTEAWEPLRQSIQLDLRRAAWAVLQSNDALYQLSLKHVKRVLLSYPAALHTSAYQSALTQLEVLLQAKLAPDLPDLSGLLNILEGSLKKASVYSSLSIEALA